MDAMIKRHTTLFLFCLLGIISYAQQMNWAKLTEDTVYYAKEYRPERLMINFSGPAQIWDLRSLKAPYAIHRRIVLNGERDGKTYANLVNGRQTDAVLLLSGRTSQITQIFEENPVCKGNRLSFTLTPLYKPFFSGVLGEEYLYRGRMVSVFAWPRHMTCVWTPPHLPDSCRITYTITEETIADGEGTLYLPTEVTSAVRYKVQIKRAVRIEIKFGLTWRDVTASVPGIRLITTKELFRFISSSSGLQVAEVEVDDGMRPLSVEFKTHPLVTRILSEEPNRPDVFAYPNPSYDVVRFQLSDLVHGHYKLKIFNILGVAVRELEFDVTDPRKTVTMDLSDLQRGTYLFRLQDSSGRSIKTKRIVLIQP